MDGVTNMWDPVTSPQVSSCIAMRVQHGKKEFLITTVRGGKKKKEREKKVPHLKKIMYFYIRKLKSCIF